MKNTLVIGRKILTGLLVVFMFLPWLSYEAGVDGYADLTAGASFSGFTIIGQSYIALLLYVIPAVLIISMFMPGKEKLLNAVFVVGPVVGAVITILLGIMVAAYMESGVSFEGVSEKCTWGIGIWLTIIDYIVMYISSMVIELSITKESFNGDGIKNIAKQSVGVFKSSFKDICDEVKKLKNSKNEKADL